jgi:hypothetical protein
MLRSRDTFPEGHIAGVETFRTMLHLATGRAWATSESSLNVETYGSICAAFDHRDWRLGDRSA